MALPMQACMPQNESSEAKCGAWRTCTGCSTPLAHLAPVSGIPVVKWKCGGAHLRDFTVRRRLLLKGQKGLFFQAQAHGSAHPTLLTGGSLQASVSVALGLWPGVKREFLVCCITFLRCSFKLSTCVDRARLEKQILPSFRPG